VKHGERLLGTLGVLRTRENAFTLQEEQLLVLFSNQAAVAMENARLFAETQWQLQHIQTLRAIDRAITSSMDLKVTLEILLGQITTHLGVDAANILLYHPATQTLETAAARGTSTVFLRKASLRMGESLAGRVALDGKMAYIPDLSQIDDPFVSKLQQAGEQFVSYIALPLIAQQEIKGVLQLLHHAPFTPTPHWMEFLESLADQAAIAIDNAQLFDRQQGANLQLTLAYDATIDGWSAALDLRDKETEGHSRRVTDLTLQLARAMGTPEGEIPHLRRGAQLHDIGKMGIPDAILLKPGPLTEAEWGVMRRHPQYALDLLLPIEYLRPSLQIPLCHHERWDGSGYPRGLKGREIPLPARIFAVVDVWDALRSDRPYRPAWSEEKALNYIHEQSGRQFDPAVVTAFLALIGETRDRSS